MDTRGALIASRPAALDYARTLRELPPSLVGIAARLAEISIYPVKGLGGLRLAGARVDRFGLVDPASGLADRAMMLAYRDENGDRDAMGIANRNEATLGLTRASFESGALVYRAPGVPALALPPGSLAPSEGTRVRVQLPYDDGPVLDATLDEGPLAAWARALFTAHPARRRFAIEDVIALRLTPRHARLVEERHRAGQEAGTLWSDGGQALVASRSTLAWMNASFAAAGSRTIPMEAFRPNLVVEGLPPNAEDIIGEVEVGEASLMFATMSIRCDAVRVDPTTGTRPDKEPLAWLAKNRPPRGGATNAATFAINAVFPAGSRGRTIRVGDTVRVLRER